MNIEIRRAKKKQGRWWVIAIDGQEIHRLPTAKRARSFAKAVPAMLESKTEAFWTETEPLET